MRRGQHRLDASLDTSVPVVVLKMVADLYAHGRLGVIRSLGRLGVPVYCLHESRWTPAALSRYSREDIAWPIEHPPMAALPTLLELGERLGGRPVLVTTDDVGALFVDEHAAELRPFFRFPDMPRGLTPRVANKYELNRLCQEHGIPTPEVVMPKRRDDLDRAIERLGLPVVVKSADPSLLRQRPNATSVTLARTRAELFDVYDRSEDWSEPNLMLQEYIPGGPETVWMFNGYFDASSECAAAFTGQKIRQHPRNTGATTLGICRSNPTVVATTRALMSRLGYRGLVDMGYRYDARDGEYKLLDLNPRLGSTFRLFVDRHGLDVVQALYRDLTGQPVPVVDEHDRRRWLVEPFDVWTFRDYHREDRLGVARWLASVARVEERAWFAWDDPRPALAMSALFVAQPVYHRLKRTKLLGPVVRRLADRVKSRPATVSDLTTEAAAEPPVAFARPLTASNPSRSDTSRPRRRARRPDRTAAGTVGTSQAE